MNLSTSSSRGDVRAILLALFLLLLVEGTVRWLEPFLSADVRNIEQIPQTLRDLAAAPGEHVLFLGNSLIREGVDMQVLRPELAARQVDVQAMNFGFVYPDSSEILDWLYVYRHNIREATQPDVLILSFAGDSLADEVPPDSESTRRLARHHTTLADTPYVFSHDLRQLAQRVDFLISKLFVSFAHRDRVRTRTFDELIPNYRGTVRAMNQIAPGTPPTNAPSRSYERFRRFLKLVDTKRVDVIIVAMPTRRSYILDPKLPRITNRAGAQFIDLTELPQLGPDDYVDNLHLNAKGAKIYSRLLGRELAPYLVDPREPAVGTSRTRVLSPSPHHQPR